MTKQTDISIQQAPAQYPSPGNANQMYLPEHVQHVQQGSDWKSTVKYIALATGVVAVLVFGVRHFIRKGQTNREQNKTLIAGNEATNAKMMKMAFDNDGWPGTDEEKIRQVMRSLKDRKSFDDMAKSYNKNYHRNLLKDMESELTSAEYQEMLYILATKPGTPEGEKKVSQYEAWARRLRSAMEVYYIGFITGTDEDAIYAVFNEMPNYAAWTATKKVYNQIYSGDLYSDLTGELWYWEVDELIAKLKKK